MGIKHFFYWFRNRYPECISSFSSFKTFKEMDIGIDVLGIDLNGIFHTCARSVHSEQQNHKTDLDIFQKICYEIDSIVDMVKPEKTLILCIDGVAGFAKMFQQRQRRFRAVKENECKTFNSNCITPGTKFMDELSKYIDFHIRKIMTLHPLYRNMEIILSNEKVPGEGEHKIIKYMKKHGDPSDRFCIYGVDSDLFMLSLSTHFPNMFILRENMHIHDHSILINIGEFSESLKREMKVDKCIDDFIFLSFLSGNDFLPNIPTLEIIEGSLDRILCNYAEIAFKKGGNIINISKNLDLNVSSFRSFLDLFASLEKDILIERYMDNDKAIPDLTLQDCMTLVIQGTETKFIFDLERYKKEYYKKKFGDDYDEQEICCSYLRSMYWTILYYIKEMPDWDWYYPHFYAPFASDLLKYLVDFPISKFHINQPVCPFLQLLAVLPPQSKDLVPSPLNEIFSDPEMAEFYPIDFEIDLEGKRNEWEGVVILPSIDLNKLKSKFYSKVINVDRRMLMRNRVGSSFDYTYCKTGYFFTCHYGKINSCKVQVKLFTI